MISEKDVRLVNFDAPTMAGRYSYTALSYCWGSPDELQRRPPVQTDSSAYTSMEAGFPISELPLTLRQAYG